MKYLLVHEYFIRGNVYNPTTLSNYERAFSLQSVDILTRSIVSLSDLIQRCAQQHHEMIFISLILVSSMSFIPFFFLSFFLSLIKQFMFVCNSAFSQVTFQSLFIVRLTKIPLQFRLLIFNSNISLFSDSFIFCSSLSLMHGFCSLLCYIQK